VIQERAWTSPIWYRPAGVARVHGRIGFGRRAASDVLTLRVSLGRADEIDLAHDDLTLRVTDADELLAVTIPADPRARRTRHLRLPGVARATVAKRRDGTLRLALRTRRRDLGAADHADHMVTVSLAAGKYRVSSTRRWLMRRGALVTVRERGGR
jgi:hypothetical protein